MPSTMPMVCQSAKSKNTSEAELNSGIQDGKLVSTLASRRSGPVHKFVAPDKHLHVFLSD